MIKPDLFSTYKDTPLNLFSYVLTPLHPACVRVRRQTNVRYLGQHESH